MGSRRPTPLLARIAFAAIALLAAIAVVLAFVGSAGADGRVAGTTPRSADVFGQQSGPAAIMAVNHPAKRRRKHRRKRAKRRACKPAVAAGKHKHRQQRHHRRGHHRAHKRVAPCAKPHKPAGRTKATTHTTNSGTHISTPGFRYIDPTFFGQHLADFAHWGQISTPPWPVTAIRFNVNWCELNPAPGEYNWAQLDNWMDYATKTGADLLYTFGDTPGWAVAGGSGGCGSSGNLAPDPPAWESFVRALVHHANGRIKYFELWNEWDASWNWAGGVDGMVALANEAAPIIHDANQGLMLLTPSISSYDAGHVLEKFLASIPPSSGVIDIVNIHTYHSAWAQDASPEATLYPLVSFVHEAMKQAGYGSYPLWSTEGGWGDQSYPAYNDPSTERAYVARNDLALLSLGVDRAYWYAFSNPAWGTLWSDSTSSQPGGLTPAGTATNELVRTAPTPGWLAGATLTAPCAKDTTGLWTCEITRPGGYIGRILWVDSGSRTIQTPPGYRTLRTLAGTSASAPPQLTVSTEPVLIES